ncbi:hypothetical protein C8R44DRAFT_974304 [Mycena epipterygia]|nr:hypothetical protein C8R44DRAFT_974304 [Mycena epipterygia]
MAVMTPLVHTPIVNPSFACNTNTRHSFHEGPYRGSSVIPDFAFGQKQADSSDLEEKVQKWLTVCGVACIFAFYFKCTDFCDPPPNHPPPAFMDPFHEHTWAAEIEKITATIYLKKPEEIHDPGIELDSQSWDLTPHDTETGQLIEDQEEITPILELVTRGSTGLQAFDTIYPTDQSFRIDWNNFYSEVHCSLIADAYGRYVSWASSLTVPLPAILLPVARTNNSGAKKKAEELFPQAKRQHTS